MINSQMKYNIALIFLLISNIIVAQSIFDTFEENNKVKTLVVNEKMFDMMSKVKSDPNDKEMQQYFNLLKKLDKLKVYSTEDTKLGKDMRTAVSNYLKTNPLEELMRVNNDKKNIKIYIKTNTNSAVVKELLLFIEGESKKNPTVILSLTGDFYLEEISQLTDKMNLPGGNDLKEASNNK